MKRTIKSITKDTSKPYHPAVGHTYDLIFTDESIMSVSGDELMGQFPILQGEDIEMEDHLASLIGKEFEIEVYN
jgi:hypothetical protein